MTRMLGARWSSQARATCRVVAPSAAGDLIQDGRPQRSEPAQRKERHEGDALACQIVDQNVIQSVREIIMVLDAHDFGDLLAFCELGGRDVAEPDMPDQPL